MGRDVWCFRERDLPGQIPVRRYQNMAKDGSGDQRSLVHWNMVNSQAVGMFPECCSSTLRRGI